MLIIKDLRADWDLEGDVFARRTKTVFAHSVAASFGLKVLLITKID